MGLLVLLYGISLFKNISYPLVWHDESDSVMVGQRILEYGYPKVHDGKNTVMSSIDPYLKVGYKAKYDAYIYMTWGNYYWAAIGVYLAKYTNDLYTKTALLRLPFAVMGFLGLILLALSARKLFFNKNHYKVFLILFTFAELFSIPLVLHLREARYFSLVVFLTAWFFYVYSSRFLYETFTGMKYCILMTLLLFLTFHVNFVASAIFGAVLGFNRGVAFLVNVAKLPGKRKSELINFIKDSIPLLLFLVLIYPFLLFFETFETSAAVSKYTGFNFQRYMTHLGEILKYLGYREFLYTFIFIKITWIVLWRYSAKSGKMKSDRAGEAITVLERFSFFATSFLIIYSLMIARQPYLLVRHYIVLQPVMTLIMIIDLTIIYLYLGLMPRGWVARTRWVSSLLLLITFSMNAGNKIPFLKGHIYEITHQYKGVLDYTIPYIRDHFKNPESLIIATNVEEFSYMYYLGSKVTIGFVYNNLEDDLKHIPDIMSYRTYWPHDPRIFIGFIQRAEFGKVYFPVYDYPLNNTPELDYTIKHLFETKYTSNDRERAALFLRVK